jgi:hypothetical protein
MMAALSLLTVAAAAVVIWHAVCVLNKMHYTGEGCQRYGRFIGFGLSHIALAAGALLAAIDAAHGILSLAGIAVTLACAGLVAFERREGR